MNEQRTDLAPISRDDEPGLLSVIERLATNPAVDVQKLSSILDLQERLLAKRAETEFNQAFSEMASKMPRIRKDGSVEYQGKKAFRFATWEAIDTVIRPLLNEHGFSLSFNTAPSAPGILITGTLLHVAGHSRSASIGLPFDASGGKNGLQAVASAFSYGKRYTGTMLLNIVTEGEDDDGVKGGTEYIDEASRKQLNKLLAETGAPLDGFLDYLGVQSIDGITVAAYPKAVNALLSTKRKKASEKAGTNAEVS